MPLGSTGLGKVVDSLEGRADVQRDLDKQVQEETMAAVRSLEHAHKEMLRELGSSRLERRF